MFFADFCEHLNELNVKLQGNGNSLDDTLVHINCTFHDVIGFQTRLQMHPYCTISHSRSDAV